VAIRVLGRFDPLQEGEDRGECFGVTGADAQLMFAI
jgi:hypothetical protein